ncbi:hypothetical protein [Thalassovita mediterranea]|jgi:hypothetical protein|uniref:hypothetical protein n=1 Tax=Thalassovita mediterranea TaxID=340021 RepID=UPI00071D4AED|nr:hypothetical protein [Thalassovita mediterranea]MCG7574074.1 hypothetical protein [Phaeobacter sp. CNT1-3]
MQQKSNSNTSPKKQDAREDRLKAALKANMARRKSQAKARAAGDESEGAEPQARFSGQAHRHKPATDVENE